MHLSQWPASRVGLACFAWVIGAGIVFIAVPIKQAFRYMEQNSPGGLSSISFGIGEPLALVIAPPLLFFIVWLVLRRPRH
jgi:hypothetical protein